MTTKRVDDLVAGDMLDLEGDLYADLGACTSERLTGQPCDGRDDDGHMITWKYEYGRVDTTERETPTCIRVDFTNGESVGFPPEHEVALAEVYQR